MRNTKQLHRQTFGKWRGEMPLETVLAFMCISNGMTACKVWMMSKIVIKGNEFKNNGSTVNGTTWKKIKTPNEKKEKENKKKK